MAEFKKYKKKLRVQEKKEIKKSEITDISSPSIIMVKHEAFLLKHRNFLDYVKKKYNKESGWVFENYQEPTTSDNKKIDEILNLYVLSKPINKKDQKFYKLIIRATPLILNENEYISQNKLKRALNTGSEHISRHVAPYLDPLKYKRRENLGYLLNESSRNIICRRLFEIFNTKPSINKRDAIELLQINILKQEKREFENHDYKKLIDTNFFNKLREYFEDLVAIVGGLKAIEEKYNTIQSINQLARELIQNKEVKSFTFNGLNRALSLIVDDLADSLPEFELIRRKLFSEDDLIELNRDYIFQKYPNISPSDLAQVKMFVKERKLIEDLNKIYFGEDFKEEHRQVCVECKREIINLPAVQFHHFGEKSTSWDVIKFLPYQEILDKMIKEKAFPMCVNCHEKKQAKLFEVFKDSIYKENLFKLNGAQIHKLINEDLKNKEKKRSKSKILAWVKKRLIIEQLYEGKCIGCDLICDKSTLPSFIFHHRTEKKSSIWSKMKTKSLDEIYNWIKNDECVNLCANCHSLISAAIFLKYADVILKNDLLKTELNLKFKDIKKRIAKFTFENKIIVDKLKRI